MYISPLLQAVSYDSHAVRGPGNHENNLGPVTTMASSLMSIENASLVGPGYIMKGSERIYEIGGQTLFAGYVKSWTEAGRAYFNRDSEKPESLFNRADQLEEIRLDAFYSFVHYNMIYGHFLLEMMPRLFLIRDLISRGYRHPVAMPGTAPDWMRKHVAEILPDAEIVHFDDTKQKLVGDILAISGDFLFMHPSIVRKYATFAEPTGSHRKVFLVRPKGHQSRRVFAGESLFSESAKALGFEIVDPSLLSFREQAALFASCSIVAGEFTSALHNTIFCPPGTAVVGVNRISDIQWRIAQACGHYLDYVEPKGGAIDWSEWTQFEADVDLFKAALGQAHLFVGAR
jgi:capsular polysaccharide biosynthesis protein